ncbi:hypothetical protein JYK22_02065, partial [Nonomuraea sp. RK-328]|nr:hypothetical protein [Nonomuraea sp. RK-328]
MIEIIRVAVLGLVTVAFSAFLVAHAIAGAPKRFSWAMFTQTKYCYFHLEVVTEKGAEPFNPLSYLGVQNILIDGWGLGVMLDYFAEVHGIRPSGHVILTDGVVKRWLEILDGRMVSSRELPLRK